MAGKTPAVSTQSRDHPHELFDFVVGHCPPWRVGQFVGEVFDFRAHIIARGRQLACVVEQPSPPQCANRLVPLLAAPAAQPPAEFGSKPVPVAMGDQGLDAASPWVTRRCAVARYSRSRVIACHNWA